MVSLERYYGKWHEIARLPNWFQGDSWFSFRKGVNSTATYYPTCECKKVKVINQLEWQYPIKFLKSFFAKKEEVIGLASIKSKTSLSVSFNIFSKIFTLGKPNYYIRELIDDDDGKYLFSIVTSSSSITEQKYAWLLSRKAPEEWTECEKKLAKDAIQKMQLYGVNKEKLITHPSLA